MRTSGLSSRPAVPSQGPAGHTFNPALERNSSAALTAAPQPRSPAARARAGVAHLLPVTQGRRARGWMEVGGTDRGRAGAAAAGRSIAKRWEPRQTLARRHSATGVCLAGPSLPASHRERGSGGGSGPGGRRGRSAGRAPRANEWAPGGGSARAGLKGIRTVRIAPRACLSLSPPHPHLSPFSALQD